MPCFPEKSGLLGGGKNKGTTPPTHTNGVRPLPWCLAVSEKSRPGLDENFRLILLR